MLVKSRVNLQIMSKQRGGRRYTILDRILTLLWKDIVEVSIYLGKTKHLFYINSMINREYLALHISSVGIRFDLLREELLSLLKREYVDCDVLYCEDTGICTIDWS